MKTFSASSVIRKKQTKTAGRHCYTPVGICLKQKPATTGNASRVAQKLDHRQFGSLSWGECKLIQPLWESVWQCLSKQSIQAPYDPEIAILGIFIRKQKNYVYTDNATLSIIVKKWNQPRRPSTGEWLHELCPFHLIGEYSAMKTDKLPTHTTKWMDLQR